MRKGFNLIELLVVLVVVSLLASLAFPGYIRMRERTYNKEARANLQLIQAAQRIYRMEIGYFYPFSGDAPTTAELNQDLRLSLPTGNPNWRYTVEAPAADGQASGTGAATRILPAGVGDGRTWDLHANPDALANCVPGEDNPANCEPPQ